MSDPLAAYTFFAYTAAVFLLAILSHRLLKVQLPNGFYQTEHQTLDEQWVDVTRRETIEGAEQAIDSSVEHYAKKLEYLKGPKVVKTFE